MAPISMRSARRSPASPRAARSLCISGADNPTTLNFLAENHIVVVFAEDVVGDYESVFARLRAKFGAELPRTVNFITGPSRSADIEQTLLFGAHGPRRLHVVVVDRPAQAGDDAMEPQSANSTVSATASDPLA